MYTGILNDNKGKAYTNEELVSVIIPAYNCEDFVGATLDSVIAQTYQNWEAILVDDCSTDNTAEIIKKYAFKDSRIKYHKLKENSGAAVSRNTAVELANGKYLAFLDSDDLWFSKKLEKQIAFMKEKGNVFSCTSYTKIDEQGNYLGKTINVNNKYTYKELLKKNCGNSTVIYDAEAVGKVKIPNIRKRNDYVMWLQVIKKAKYLHGIDEPLGCHRIRTGSLSRNKFSLVGYHWKVYREIEKLSLFQSSYLVVYWIIAAVLKLK